MKHHKVDSTTLARQFCEVIKSWLTDEQLNEVNRLNKTEDYYSACASHNFCDANQAMIEAMESLGLPWQYDYASLVNSAWDIARLAEFDGNRCQQESHSLLG